MDNILDRISQISHLEGVSIGKIELIIGASKGVLYKAIQKNTDIQAKWIVAIAENFPQYSPEWILLGKGNMSKTIESISMVSDIQEVYAKEDKIIDGLKSQIYYQDQIIDSLRRENKLLWKIVDGENGDNGDNGKKSLG